MPEKKGYGKPADPLNPETVEIMELFTGRVERGIIQILFPVMEYFKKA